jgi:hypothetical protein
METLAETTARLVARHPLAALSLQEVVHLLRRESPGPPPDEEFLLQALQRRPDLVRILDPWQGVWTHLGASDPSWLPLLREQGLSPRWPLVVAVAEVRPADAAPPGGGLDLLRRSLLWLARNVDDGSPLKLTRWCRILREHRAIVESISGGRLAH